jgi:pimeloyl-ACP methyl ester carboxylesterase
MAPTIFIVPGIWEGPSVWDNLISILTTKYNFPVKLTKLISTGQTSPNAPRINDDIAYIKSDLTSAVEAAGPDGIIAILHSAGGFLGSSAMEGLTTEALQEQGKQGGVKKIVFLSGAVAPEGHIHEQTPFMKIEVRNSSFTIIESMKLTITGG